MGLRVCHTPAEGEGVVVGDVPVDLDVVDVDGGGEVVRGEVRVVDPVDAGGGGSGVGRGRREEEE